MTQHLYLPDATDVLKRCNSYQYTTQQIYFSHEIVLFIRCSRRIDTTQHVSLHNAADA